jgi:hypothetical protein
MKKALPTRINIVGADKKQHLLSDAGRGLSGLMSSVGRTTFPGKSLQNFRKSVTVTSDLRNSTVTVASPTLNSSPLAKIYGRESQFLKKEPFASPRGRSDDPTNVSRLRTSGVRASNGCLSASRSTNRQMAHLQYLCKGDSPARKKAYCRSANPVLAETSLTQFLRLERPALASLQLGAPLFPSPINLEDGGV